MSLERPLFWHQGLFLQPQHFQLSEQSLQALFIPYQNYLAPHFWGVCRMEIGSDARGMRSVGIKSGAFLFHDGSYVVPPENALVQPRSLPEESPAHENPCTVYLGLKKWNPGAENVTILESGAPLTGIATRFAAPAEATTRADLHAGGAQAELRQLHFVLQIFWESEVELLGDYLLMPVARLEKGGAGLQLSRQFIPPCLTLAGSPALSELVREISDQLASRSRCLEGCKKERGVQPAEFGSKDLVYLLALRTLNRYLARLHHFREAGQVHPWQVYSLLGELVAELSCFSETVTALGESAGAGARLLPDYRHTDLGGCFTLAHDLVLKLLDQITAGPEYALALCYDGNYFGSEMKPAHFEGRHRFYLVLDTEEDPKGVALSIATLAKLSSKERMPLLIA